MISVRLLDVALVVEAALLVVALALLLLRGAMRGAIRTARRRRVAEARHALRGAARDAVAGGAPAALRALPPGHAVALLSELAPSLAGAEREILRTAARERGLLAAAEGDCRSRRWRRRLHAVRVLALAGGGEEAVPALLADPRPEVRAQAAEWVLGHPEPELVARLVGMLDDLQPFTRFTAMDTLIRLGARAVEPLADAIGANSGREALLVAARIADPRLAGPAAARLADEDPEIRAWAVRMLGALGGEQHAGEVVARLDDPAPAVRAAAAVALGRLGHWPAAPAVAERLRDPAWQVRRDAALSLRALGPAGELLLERALRDDDPFARDMARQTLDLPEAVLPA